ncbi:acyl transferase/acyl hydrolase/lysophospholipase [Fomitopsis serialis]|uniref:acyl transferase/acyl hydrolase/lysophospholipase n=1 Tax=Fomitopsis serialis TaxID=139415 RepID=UPI00200768DC|nr:acyl transferase/acyl hydrolase/lysophospholipase [Neoantrodia serialis]KAH9928292.1 acyl transferase/acyl hydrolase/lysophospholipase [Neoantrodia serialis]
MPDGGSAPTVIVETTPTAHRDVLKEPTTQLPPKPAHAAEPVAVVLGLSGDSAEAVEELREHHIRALTDDTRTSLVDLAYSSTAACGGATPAKYRLAVSGRSREELAEKLRAASVVPGVGESPRKVAFLFSGQGGQSFGMGAALYRAVPTFRQAIDECQEKLVSWGFEEMLPFIQGVSQDDESGRTLEAEHTALFSLEYALARMWTVWGVVPDAVLGHRWACTG